MTLISTEHAQPNSHWFIAKTTWLLEIKISGSNHKRSWFTAVWAWGTPVLRQMMKLLGCLLTVAIRGMLNWFHMNATRWSLRMMTDRFVDSDV